MPLSGGVAGRHRPATSWVPSGNRPVVSRGATNRLMAEVPPGNRSVGCVVPEGNKEGSRGVVRHPRALDKKSDAPRKGVPEGWIPSAGEPEIRASVTPPG